MKDKYSRLSSKEKIKKYKKENKTLLICGIICSIIIIFISILFFILELDKVISIGFIMLLPFSWWIGYYIPKKENDKKIKELEKK
ncbi:MAG: hypothetical protein E7339_00955 [Clostridiales bacterium]|nr:hypothetical protein [Clostridiales bacterium]